jgi:hypothetical protein
MQITETESGKWTVESKTAEDAARMTILKNTTVFKLVGTDAFGLVEWYPRLKKEKEANGSTAKKRGRPRKVESQQDEAGMKKSLKAKKDQTAEAGKSGDEKPSEI